MLNLLGMILPKISEFFVLGDCCVNREVIQKCIMPRVWEHSDWDPGVQQRLLLLKLR